MSKAVPPKIQRPALALWLWERGIKFKPAGELFGCSYETVRAICRPFDDPDRRVPTGDLMRVIVEITGIRPADFYPPQLNGDASAMTEAAA